jgi:amino acid transporter
VLESFGYKQELKRSLTLGGLLVYGLVFIVPIAPVAVFGIVYNASHGMVPLVYAIGLVAMLFTALSYMAMVHEFPIAGSVYSYAARSLGPVVGFFAGWAILLDYLLVPTLTYVACAIAAQSALPAVPQAAWIIGLLAFATAVNYYGIETTARMNFLMLAFQVVILALFIVIALVALAHHVNGAHLSLAPIYSRTELTPSLIFGALSLAVLSFLGFDAVSTLSEEARDGSRAVARATALSLCLSAFLFMVQTYLASLFVLGRTAFAPGDPTNTAFYGIAAMLGGYGLKFLLAVPGVLLSGLASALSAQAATARLLFGMARDGVLPRGLAHVNERRRVPERAIFLVAGVTLVLGLILVGKLELLTSMVAFGALLGFLLLHLSVIVHFMWRQRSRNWLRHLVAPAIGFCIIAFVLWNAEINAKIAGGCWIAVGVVVLLMLRRRGRSPALPLDR